jgi:hypothetical protein
MDPFSHRQKKLFFFRQNCFRQNCFRENCFREKDSRLIMYVTIGN